MSTSHTHSQDQQHFTPHGEQASYQYYTQPSNGTGGKTAFEWIEVAGDQLVSTVKKLVAQGNVRRIILRDQSGKELFSFSLTAGALVSGVVVIATPVLAAIGAIAALVTKVRLEIERTDTPPPSGADQPEYSPAAQTSAPQESAFQEPAPSGAPHPPTFPQSADSSGPVTQL
ncbi:MAG: DUF4342 domain-containing protein [Actinomycetaceae bacterium]|nr:DUF4342 domain-containing protein [Actinomycetaceae bacterium]